MADRCMWPRRGGGICDTVCEGRYCAHHAKVIAVREAGAALRAARVSVAEARDAVIEAAKRYVDMADDEDGPHLLDAVPVLREAERAEAEALARVEALR